MFYYMDAMRSSRRRADRGANGRRLVKLLRMIITQLETRELFPGLYVQLEIEVEGRR